MLAHALLLTFPGVPAIYIQSILGSRNDYEGVERLGYNRAINRRKFQAGEIDIELEDATQLRHKIYNVLTRMIAVRRQQCVFHPDSKANFSMPNERVLKITRTSAGGEQLTAFFNFQSKVQTLSDNIPFGVELLTRSNITNSSLTLDPWQVMWIKHR
ncbi:Sucrose phosphorylase [compost metagenome]